MDQEIYNIYYNTSHCVVWPLTSEIRKRGGEKIYIPIVFLYGLYKKPRSSTKIRSGKKRLEDPPKRDNETGLEQTLQLNVTVSFSYHTTIISTKSSRQRYQLTPLQNRAILTLNPRPFYLFPTLFHSCFRQTKIRFKRISLVKFISYKNVFENKRRL